MLIDRVLSPRPYTRSAKKKPIFCHGHRATYIHVHPCFTVSPQALCGASSSKAPTPMRLSILPSRAVLSQNSFSKNVGAARVLLHLFDPRGGERRRRHESVAAAITRSPDLFFNFRGPVRAFSMPSEMASTGVGRGGSRRTTGSLYGESGPHGRPNQRILRGCVREEAEDGITTTAREI